MSYSANYVLPSNISLASAENKSWEGVCKDDPLKTAAAEGCCNHSSNKSNKFPSLNFPLEISYMAFAFLINAE